MQQNIQSHAFFTCSNPLKDIFNYTQIQTEFDRKKIFNEWLEFVSVFSNSGKQGVVGLFRLSNKKKEDIQLVFKFSKYINYLIKHEYSVMKSLNDLSDYCFHFCKCFGIIKAKVDTENKKNPFNTENTKSPLEQEVLLMEYVNAPKMYNYIKSPECQNDVLYSCVKQVLLATRIAQLQKKFTHYDLHSFNILMKKCDEDLVLLYVLDEHNQFCVPTFGYYPVIIDYGYSYVSEMENGYLYPSLLHTDVGFTSDRFDEVSDSKLFLISVANDLKKHKKDRKSSKFRKIVKNIFHELQIDWESGWDETGRSGASMAVLKILEKCSAESDLFTNYDHYCIDILQSLIIIPLEPQKCDNIQDNYAVFLKEFVKIENQIKRPFYSLCVLKCIIDLARQLRPTYLNSATREKAVTLFRRFLSEKIDSIISFCKLDNVHYEKMLCSLYCLSKNIEGVLFEQMRKCQSEKTEEYSKLPFTEIENIFGVLETNIPSEYTFNVNTKILAMNSLKKTCVHLELSQENCDQINEIHNLSKGSFLYDLI